MAVMHRNNFENGLANGTPLTVSNSANGSQTGFNAEIPSVTGLCTVTTTSITGTRSFKTDASNTAVHGFDWNDGNDASVATEFVPAWLTSRPTTVVDVIQIRSASLALTFRWNGPTNQWRLVDHANTVIKTFSPVIAVGDKPRIAIWITKGTSTTTGTINAAIYASAQSTTVVDSVSVTNADVGTVNLTTLRVGHLTAGSAFEFFLDDLQFNTGSAAFIGPYPVSNVAPVANAGVDQTAIVQGATVQTDGSGSTDSDGTVASYLWTVEGSTGPTPVLSSSSAQSPTFVAKSNTSSYVVTLGLVVTDNLGASSTKDTATYTINPYLGTVVWDGLTLTPGQIKVWNGTALIDGTPALS